MNQNKRMHSINIQNIDLTRFSQEGRVLDIGGGGEGVIGQLLGEKVVAIDYRKDELEEAGEGPLKIIMDARELKFLDKTFDGITSFFTLMYIKKEEHKKVFKEIHRVLKDGGIFTIWDVNIPKYTGGIKDIFLVPLEVNLKDKKIKTTYGISWDQAEQNMEYYIRLGEIVGLEVINAKEMDQIYSITFKKSNRLSYLRNPCDYASLPYWKETMFQKPSNIKIYHEKNWMQLSEGIKNNFNRVDKFFRIKHTLEQINIPKLPEGYKFRVFNPNKETDYDNALRIIGLSYANIDITKDTLKGYMKNKVYNKNLWVFIDKVNGSKNIPVAFGLADLDPTVKEGILEWIQVLPQYRVKGLGTSLVNELLIRMKEKAKFATVSGDCNNSSSPIDLYRKCGFIGNSIWYIAYEK